EQSAADKNDALDACIDKIIRQIRKNKTKLAKSLRDNAFEEIADDVPEEKVFDVVKHKQFNLRPMSIDEAILQMNLVGHTFFMFKNAETGDVNVVYKRDDGNYAVLEPSKG
ncbi:MAG: HPF/RaiA family ribosome-associated protein, partial [Ruminiclostridium sp.]